MDKPKEVDKDYAKEIAELAKQIKDKNLLEYFYWFMKGKAGL